MTCLDAASASAKVWAKLTPSIGAWTTPRIWVGASTPEGLQHGRDHVDGVGVLGADPALGLDPGG
jgi:hypothetical protein